MTRKKTAEPEVKRIPIMRCHPDYQLGLTAEQVRERKINGWENESVEPPMQTTKEIIKENVFTYFNLIFAVLAVLLITAGSFRDLTFLPVIIANTCIGIIQEIRSKRVLEKMSMLNAPTARVVRDGKEWNVKSESLVIDDIVIFASGNQICADAVVVAGEVMVNESLLTGESEEITKKPGDRLMSGSFIVAGQCHARLEAVGADSYISKLTLEAKAMQKGEKSEMIRSLDKLVKFAGIALIPIGIILMVQSLYFNGESWHSSITSMVAAVIGMIPEGLYLLASVALAVSAIRLARKRVLLHDMRSIETLARVNVLCVDKTGTITENTMSVQELVPVEKTDEENREAVVAALSRRVGDFVKAMTGDNSTMKAMKSYFKEGTGASPVRITPFTSKTKYSGVTFENEALVLGAPEFVLRAEYEHYRNTIEGFANKGYRVLVFGVYSGVLNGEPLTGWVEPLAFILLANPVRAAAPATFRYFKEQGVDIKVISGDNPMTVAEVARKAGIANADAYIDATQLKTPKDIYLAARDYTVFGRVTPNQKRELLQALKKQGKTVAMTGDGVNDVLALKDADCSVAMASGSDAAVQAAQVVLLDSDFSRMPSVVLEGRRVVNNIQRSASLFLVKNIYSFLLAIFSMISMIQYPLAPSQVSLVSMFTIGIPAFFLALQPNKEIIKGHFLTNVVVKALPAGLTGMLAVSALSVFGQVFGVGSDDISTASTILLAIVGFMILFRICRPFDSLRIVVWVGCIIGILLCGTFLPELFAISSMSTKCVLLFVVFSIATEPVHRYLTIVIEWLRGLYIKLQRKLKKRRAK